MDNKSTLKRNECENTDIYILYYADITERGKILQRHKKSMLINIIFPN
jgi:hypothetical protein